MSEEESQEDRVAKLEEQIKVIQEEFNNQRAKLKDLYIAKEGECKQLNEELETLRRTVEDNKQSSDLIQQLQDQNRRANEEIQSLQTLVNEAYDESSSVAAKLKSLEDEYQKLTQETTALKEHHRQLVNSESNTPLAPVFNQVKTIVKKLGRDDKERTSREEPTIVETKDSKEDQNLEDSMKQAYDDAELMRSIIIPLEEEIKNLKEKLRDTCAELDALKSLRQAAIAIPPSDSASSLNRTGSLSCEMCQNYETQLVQCQDTLRTTETAKFKLEKQLNEYKAELEVEIALRKDLDKQWQEKREQHRIQVESLTSQVKKTEDLFRALVNNYNEVKENTNRELLKLTAEREDLHKHLEMLQKDNDFLSGKYISHSSVLQEQEINLPQSVSELQVMVLQLNENIINLKIASEDSERKYLQFQDEANLLRIQQYEQEREKQAIVSDLKHRIDGLEQRIHQHEEQYHQLQDEKMTVDLKNKDLEKQISQAQLQIMEISEAKEKFEKLHQELRGKCTVLQQELDNNEAVQKDFVKLSQSLQMQLEKIRSENTQVRWQDEDEADYCDQCKRDFTVTRRKHHCRHCGTIFCDNCLTKTVPSRTNKKQVRVCDICHTLLVSSSAPYFSNNINL